MLRKTHPILLILLTSLALVLMSGLANAQNAARGWDGKVKQVVTAVNIKFDSTADFDNFAAGKLPLNFILKNPASGQTITLASRLVSQGFKPSENKNDLTIYVVIDNLTAPIWDDKGCVDTKASAENAAGGGGVNITLTYAACGAQNRPGAPLKGVDVKLGRNEGAQNRPGAPLKGVDVKLGRNEGHNMTVTPGGSEVTENSAEYFKLKMNPSSNGVKRSENIIILSSGKGAGSPKAQGF